MDSSSSHIRQDFSTIVRFTWKKKVEIKEDESQVMATGDSARFDTMRLIRCFSKFPVIQEIGVQPSVYVNELLRPYKERLPQLEKELDCRDLFEGASPRSLYDKWDVRPRFVFFNNWAPREEHEAIFTVRNKYRTSRLVKARLEERCDVLSLEEMTKVRRLASMVTVSYRVRFRPRELRDYLHAVLISSEQESFRVYVLALAPRPLINFPDRIDFGEALVNFKNEKRIQLKNIGKISTTVTFEMIGIIRVNEKKITLSPDEECCVTVILNSRKLGLINSQIIANYETGEKVYINVTADCQPGNIHIEKNHMTFDKTYIGLKSTKSLWLQNGTGHIIRFKWLRTEDTQADDNIHSKLSRTLTGIMCRHGELAMIEDLEDHDQIMGKVLDDETNVLRQNFYFCDASFDISPMEGTIFPNTSMNFQITFLPTSATPYQTVAFLEVEGLLNRIKVMFQGVSKGPTIAFNLNTIDCGKIFICSSHDYVVMVRNSGNVKGTLVYMPGEILCGGQIACKPSRMELLPDETKYMEIHVESPIVGHFVEDIYFQIEESKETHKITIQGEVINPRLQMDKSEINYGDIALGMPFEQTLRIQNDSSIKVDVEFSVDGDGNMPVVRIDLDYDLHLPANYNPKEFHLEPEFATIESGASVTVKVRVISNKVRQHRAMLAVYLWGVMVEEASVPLRYRSVIPKLVATPPEIVMRYAFTGYEYCHELVVSNQSSLPTYFAVLPQEEVYNPYILYRLENECGFLDEHSSQAVKVYIKVLSLKPCKERLRLRVFGLHNAAHASIIKAFGMGPVVNPSAFNLNWGQIPIMEKVEKKFQLINVSPIPAYYKINFMKHHDVWTVDYQSGHISPDSSSEVILTARVLDSGLIKDQLWVEIAGSRDININLSAYGQGISIFTDPVIFPVYDIGSVFKHEKQTQTIKVTNVGNKHHTLLFTTSKDFKKMTKLTAEKEQGKYFKLNPYRLDLPGGSTQEIVLSFKWNEDAVLEDTYYCYGTINNTGKRITFGTTTIRAKFTDPQFFTDPSELYMKADVSEHDTVIEPLHQTLKLKSLWSTKLSVICSLNFPFRFDYFTLDNKVTTKNLELEPGSTYALEIFFDPPNMESRRTRVIRDVLTIKYIGHTVKTFINLTGEVNFPNLYLSTKLIDFGCVEPGGEYVCQAELKNTSPLIVNFEWDWQGKTITFLKVMKNDGKISMNEEPELPSLTSEMVDERGKESEFSPDSSVMKEERIFNKAEHQSFYQNLLREKYYTEDAKLPRNLEVLITELMGAKYEMEKAARASCKKKQELVVDWGKKIKGKVEGCGATDDAIDNASFGLDSSLGMSDGFKAALGLISPPNSSDESLEVNTLLQTCPQDVLEGETIANLEQCMKKEPVIIQDIEKASLDLTKILDISPCRETLEPKDCLNITLRFSPPRPMKLVAEAICEVRGGPSQDLQITGFSYPLDYEVFPEIINFGLGPFCEVWCSALLVWNKSLKEVKVVVTTPSPATFMGDTSNASTMPLSVGIIPSKKHIKPFESSSHQVLIYPGCVGEIDQIIFVQVDNEEPIPVHFVGYATPHQIFIGVPHLLVADDRLEEYHSIGRLTSFWFELNLKDLLPSSIAEFELDEILEQIQETYVYEDWDLLMARDDLVPSIDDINMAYERYICEKFAKTFETFIPTHVPSKVGCGTFFNLKFPAYVIDFGLVIAGTKAVYNVPYSNYLPMKAEIRVIYPSDVDTLEKFGVNLKIPKTQQLKGFEESSFELSVRPLKDVFKGEEFESKMNFDFQIEVICGGVIPITVKALVTHPVLVAPHSIDFDGLKLGYRSVVKFKLRNISKVDCEWIAVISPAKNTSYYFGKKGQAGFKTSPFHIKPVCGYLHPNHYTVITAMFEPKHEIPYEADINFYANMNNRYMKVRLRGYGIEPKLLIRDISFGYTIPFSEPLKKYLNVYNPTLFPLEVYIHGVDRQQLVLRDAFRCFMKYYKKSVIGLPSHFFTTHGTNEMWKMYNRLVRAAIEKYVQDTGTFLTILLKQKYSKMSSKKILSSTDSNKYKASKKAITTKTLMLKSMFIKRMKSERHSLSFGSIQKFDLMDYLIDKEFSRKSLSAVIRDYIANTNTFKCPHINFAKSLRKFEIQRENTFRDGNIIILHHSPFSHPGTFAWLLKKHTGIQPINLDKVIYTEIKEGISEESLLIRDKLFNFYMVERNNYQSWSQSDILSRETYDRYPFPVKSLKGLLKFAHRNYFRTDDPHYFKLSQHRPIKSVERSESSVLLGISREHFQTILLRRLQKKLEKGILIKSLSSKFFATPMETLHFLLDLFKVHRNLNVISLYTTIEQNFRINKNVLDGEVIDFFYKMTGENILESSPSFIKKVGEEFLDQKKKLSKSFSSAAEVNKKKKPYNKKTSSARFTTSSKKRKSGKIRMMKSAKEIEIESKFFNYQKEVFEIQTLLEDYERISPLESDTSHGDISSTMNMSAIFRKTLQSKKREHSVIMHKLDLKIDEKIGVPFWLLYHYPYTQDYQFSLYPECLASLGIVEHQSSSEQIKPVSIQYKKLHSKSYFLVSKLPKDTSKLIPMHKLFNITPVLKLKRKKFVLKYLDRSSGYNVEEGSSFERMEDKSVKQISRRSNKDLSKIENLSVIHSYKNDAKKTSLTQRSESTIKSNESLANALIKVEKYCSTLQHDLLKELDQLLLYRCRDKLTRQVVKPLKFVSWEVQFEPRGCTVFNQCIPLGISGCGAVKCVNIFAGCDIPDIDFDPASLFSEVDEQGTDLEEVFKPCYLLLKNVFHFGMVIINASSHGDSTFASSAPVKIKNTSNVDVLIHISTISEEKCNSVSMTQQTSRVRSTEKMSRREKNLSSVRRSMSSKLKKTKSIISSRTFFCDHIELKIEPGGVRHITISAAPVKHGLQSYMYVFSIENNPKVYLLKAVVHGIHAKVEFRPKEIAFEEVVLYRSVSKCFLIDNFSKMPLKWRVLDPGSLEPLIVLSKNEGLLTPLGQDPISITYQANSVDRVTKDLIISVYSPIKKEIELQRHTFKLVLKSYSVDVNFHFASSGNDHLELGNIGINDLITSALIIENCGPHAIAYSVLPKFDDEMFSLRESLKVIVHDEVGQLRSNDSHNIEMTITCNSEIELKAMPFIFIEIFDYNSEELIARIPGLISLHSYYPQFIVRPTQTLNFGDLEIGSFKRLEIILENSGFIDLSFRFLTHKLITVAPEENEDFDDNGSLLLSKSNRGYKMSSMKASLQNLTNLALLKKVLLIESHKLLAEQINRKLKVPIKNLSKKKFKELAAKLSKVKMRLNIMKKKERFRRRKSQGVPIYGPHRKVSGSPASSLDSHASGSHCVRKLLTFDGTSSTSFQASPFEIFPAKGFVAPGDCQICSVLCCPVNVGTFQKAVNLRIFNAQPEKSSVPMQLYAKCSIPKTNLGNYDSVFREFKIAPEFYPPNKICNEGMPYGIFCSSLRTLRFYNVIVGVSWTFNIYIQSENHLPAAIHISLEGENEIFTLEDQEDSLYFSISAYETRAVPVTFYPCELGEYEAKLKITLKAAKNIRIETATFSLQGGASLPTLEVVQDNKSDSNYPLSHIHKVDFEYVHMESTSTKFFTIRNSGTVTCDFWIEILTASSDFMIKCTPEAMKTTLLNLDNANFDSSTVFRLKPAECISFEVVFKPVEIGVRTWIVPIHITYNPYEQISVRFIGEGFHNDIMIKGLECIGSNILSSSGTGNSVEYKLDFGGCCCGKQVKKNFIIKNNTQHIIRFEIINENCPEIIFLPSIGHIFRASMKEVSAYLLALVPSTISAACSVVHNGMVYKDSTVTIKDWDNSLTVITRLEEKKIHLDIGSRILKNMGDLPPFEEPQAVLLSFVTGEIGITASAIADKPAFEVSVNAITYTPVLIGQVASFTFNVRNISNVEASFELVVSDEVSLKTSIHRDLADFTFGPFNCELMKLSKFETEPSSEKNEDHNWPKSLPPDLEVYDYYNIFLEKQHQGNPGKWDYLRLKTVTQIYDLPEKKAHSDTKEKMQDTLCAINMHSDILHDATIEFEESEEQVEGDGATVGGHIPYDEQNVFWADIKYGSIKPSESINVQLMFSPKHSSKYEANVKLLSEFDQSVHTVFVNGMGYLPLCHIEIEKCDYLTNRQLQLQKIPFQTKAIIVNSFSTEYIVRKEFNVYNTTEVPFHFKWYCLKSSSKEQKFKCFTSEGTIDPQSKGEMLFSFCSLEYGVCEALWLLCIKEFILQQPILFVGISKDPEITIEPKCIILRPAYKSSKTSAEVSLINQEDSRFMFHIDEEHLTELRSRSYSFNVTPTEGHLEPKSTVKILVEYIPDLLIEQSINVYINIEPSKKNLPFMICVKKYMMLPLIYCVKQNSERIELNFEEKNNNFTLSVDKVTLREPYNLSFTINNIGEIPLHIECLAHDAGEATSLEIEEESGLVFPSKSTSFNVQITAHREGLFKHPLTIKVSDGPRLHLSLIGTGVSPLFRFSFDFYDFGVCLIQKTDPLMHSVMLNFSNLGTSQVLIYGTNMNENMELTDVTRDEKLTSYDILARLESEGSKGCFSVNLKSLLVPPRSMHNILICFNPVEADNYEETIMFSINNSFEYSIKLTGEGDFFDVEIDNPECHLIDFGLVNAGKLVSKDVTLVNNSKVPANFSVYSIERNEITTIKLNIKPAAKVIKLAPGETCILEISFYGTERLKDFSSTVMYSAYGEKGILFCIKASVIDYEISVDQRALLFEPTTIGCPTTLKFAIINSGDIGTRFNLETNLLSEVFVVKPVAGYSCPGTTIIIEVMFLPNTPMQYHNNMILCVFENYHPISVTVTGVGVSLPMPMKTIKFITTVRAQTTRYVLLNNSLSIEQTVHAMLDGEYFCGEKYIKIPPQDSAKYEIYYTPLTQTKHHYHLGSLFCAFSNGGSVLYKLLGTSLPPTCTSKLTWCCQARKKVFGSITLESFSPSPETYEFTLQCDHASCSVFYILEACDTISLPANGKQEFAIGLVVYKECTIKFTAIFKNICSEEYQKFQIMLNVEPPVGPHTVCVRSHVGKRDTWKVPLINPMNKRNTFVLLSYHKELVPKRRHVQVKPKKKVRTKISYLNTSSTVSQAITIKTYNQYLGEETFTLCVSTMKPLGDEEHVFEANIGSSATYWIPITNSSTELCSCRAEVVSNELCIKQPFFNVPSGKTYKLEVEFMPAEFGAVLLRVKVLTSVMGVLTFRIKGIGYQPKLQGSYKISKGGTLKLNFTNVFNVKTNFLCEVNSQEFLVRTPSFSLLPKEEMKIEIQHLLMHDSLPLKIAASYCKVSVTSTNHDPNLQWIYYVKTIPDDSFVTFY